MPTWVMVETPVDAGDALLARQRMALHDYVAAFIMLREKKRSRRIQSISHHSRVLFCGVTTPNACLAPAAGASARA